MALTAETTSIISALRIITVDVAEESEDMASEEIVMNTRAKKTTRAKWTKLPPMVMAMTMKTQRTRLRL